MKHNPVDVPRGGMLPKELKITHCGGIVLYGCLSTEQQINKKQIQSQLNPKLHHDEIVTLHGRFINADLPEDAIMSILLLRQEHFLKLLLQNIHHRIRHSGLSQTFAQLSQKCWVPRVRTAVKMILKRCLICPRFQGQPYKVKPFTPRPRSAVIRSMTFTNTAQEYFEPS